MKLLNMLAFLDKQYAPLPGKGKQFLLFIIVNAKRIWLLKIKGKVVLQINLLESCNLCLFVCPIITQEPLDRFPSNLFESFIFEFYRLEHWR